MRLNRSRYVTVCQQFLVTGVVLTVGFSAAGVMTLEIVAPQQPGITAGDVAPAVKVEKAFAVSKPVTPTVHEVAVAGVDHAAQRSLPSTGEAKDPDALAPGVSARSQAQRSTPRATRLALLTAPMAAHGFATVGVTWNHGITLAERAISVQVRSERHGTWSRWSVADYHTDHGPDADSGETTATSRPGTDALVVGYADRVQVRVRTLTGRAPAGTRVSLIDPGVDKTTLQAPAIDTAKLPRSDVSARTAPVESTGPATTGATTATSAGDVSLSAMAIAPKPQIYSRAQWGANEKLRDQSPPSYGTVQTGFVHHTVNANNYTAEQVPALLRGIYAYHTQSRGWRDIGYNYLVDRFGRIWEGRYGGVDRAVVGAHTLGYNEVSFAMSAIGNYDIAQPPQAVLDAYASLFAWKLSLYNIPANATNLLVKGKRLQAINGHRDVGQTACPGRYLYAQIPYIRARATAIQQAAQNGTSVPPSTTTAPAPAPVVSAPDVTSSPAPAAGQPAFTPGAAANLTGSSWPDLVLQDSTGAIRVLSTNGQTGFTAPVATGGAWAGMSVVTALGDVTGDGVGDVLGRGAGGVSKVYRGLADGRILSTGIAPTKAFRGLDLVTGAGDLTGDRRRDVVARSPRTKGLVLVPGRGHGRFGKARRLTRAGSARGYLQLTGAGDLTGDRRPDLVARTTGNTLVLIPGRRGGRLGAPRRLTGLGTGYDQLQGGGDLTGDGIGDLVVRQASTQQTYILPGTGHGGFGHTVGPFAQTAGLSRLSAGPTFGAGTADLVGLRSDGALTVLPTNGRSNVSGLSASTLRPAGVTQLLNVGDWDGDGRGDLITREAGGATLVLRRGLGNGQFAAGTALPGGWSGVSGLSAVGDVTGDGRPDLVGRNSAGTMLVFPGAGAGGFGPTTAAPATLRTFNLVGSGVWHTALLPGSVMSSNDSSFVPFAGYHGPSVLRDLGVSTGYDWLLGRGDLDGDGVADLVVREAATGNLWLLPGLPGSNGFGPRRFLAGGFAGWRLGS